MRGGFMLKKTPLAFLIALSALLVSARPAAAKSLQFFATADYYFHNGVEDKIVDQNADAVAAIGTANGEVTTTNGAGGRLGARTMIGNIFDLGFSAGFVQGPKIESTIDTPLGHLDETTKTQFIRGMV